MSILFIYISFLLLPNMYPFGLGALSSLPKMLHTKSAFISLVDHYELYTHSQLLISQISLRSPSPWPLLSDEFSFKSQLRYHVGTCTVHTHCHCPTICISFKAVHSLWAGVFPWAPLWPQCLVSWLTPRRLKWSPHTCISLHLKLFSQNFRLNCILVLSHSLIYWFSFPNKIKIPYYRGIFL